MSMCFCACPLRSCGGTPLFTYREANGNRDLDIKDDNLGSEVSRNRDRSIPGAQHRAGAIKI